MIKIPLYELKKLFEAGSMTIVIAFLCVKNRDEKIYLKDISEKLNINQSQLSKGLGDITSWFFWSIGKDNYKKSTKYIKYNGKAKYINHRTRNTKEVEISDKVINFTMDNYKNPEIRNAIKLYLARLYFKSKYNFDDEVVNDIAIEFLGWENRTTLVNKYIEIIRDNLVEEV